MWPRRAVFIDTSVFSLPLAGGRGLGSEVQPILAGRPTVISFQSVAEVRYGALRAGRGAARAAP